MKKKTFFTMVTVCFVLAGLMGCKANTQPETTPSMTTPYNLLDNMNAKPTSQKISGDKKEYSIQSEPNEIKSIIGTFNGYLLASGATRNIIKVQLIDATDAKNPKVLRTMTYYAGSSFMLRQYFPGTKTIAIRIANMGDTQNTVQLKFQ